MAGLNLPAPPARADETECLVVDDARLIVYTAATVPAARGAYVSEIAAELHAAGTRAERQLIVRTALRAIGFEWLCYYRLTRIGEHLVRAICFGEYAPPGWLKAWLEQGHYAIDPRLAFACRHQWPLVWDLASLSAAGPVPGAAPAHLARFIADAGRCGLRSGITFGLVNAHGLDDSVISFGSGNPARAWIADIVVGQAYAMGLGLHEFLSHQAWPQAPCASGPGRGLGPGLSAVQHRVLSCLMRGLSDREIAWQLDMSSHNVDYHVRQLKKKYSVQNRVQLAYLAGRLMIE